MMGRVGAVHTVFVTGATGFVGRAVVHALRADGLRVRCLVRRGSEHDLRGLEAIERVEGDVLVRQTLDEGIGGCDAVVHLVGIIREHRRRGITFEHLHVDGTLNVLAAAAAANVRRYLHMSALGTSATAQSLYHQTKWLAEEAVRASALPWTIFRPSVIYGKGDDFVSMLARMVEKLPVVPVIGEGRQRVQPVPVEQVAEGFRRALAKPETVKQTYEVGGPEAVSLVELIDAIGRALGHPRVRKIHLPIRLMQVVAAALQGIPSFPLTTDQIRMLGVDNTCAPEPFFRTFGGTPIPLQVGLTRMLG
jgi:NADH dehydrogenase